MDRETQNAVRAYIDAHRDEIKNDLITLCRVPSVSVDGEDYPYGEEVNRALRTARSLCEKRGLFCRVEEKKGYAVAFPEKEKENVSTDIGLFCHCDVVPADESDWTVCPPFEPKQIGGFLFGRGVDDNKGAAVASIYLLDMIKSGVLPLRSSLMIYFGGDEERGMSDIHNFLTNESRPEICLVPDNGAPVSFGEKGILRLVCTAKTPFSQIVSFAGGTVVNAVIGSADVSMRDEDGALYRELCGLIAGKDAFSVSHEGTLTTLDSRGAAAHAAYPANSVNAAVEAAKLLCKAESLCGADRDILAGMVSLFSDPFGSGANIDAEDEKFGKNTFVLGVCELCDDTLVCRVDCRFGRTRSAEEIAARIDSAAKTAGFRGVEVEEEKECYTAQLPERTLSAFLEAYRKVSDPNGEPYYSAGGTYARYLSGGLSCSMFDSYGLNIEYPTLPQGHGEAHQPDETISLSALYKGIFTMANILSALDESR